MWFLLPGGAAKITVHKGQLSPENIVMTNCGGSNINEAFLQIWKDIYGKSLGLFVPLEKFSLDPYNVKIS